MQEKRQKVYARLHLLSAGTPNPTEGVGDGSYSVLKLSGKSSLNAPYAYRVTFVSDAELSVEKLADTDAKIMLRDENSPMRKREIFGKIAEIGESTSVAKKQIYRATVVSPFYYLQFNKRYKIYQEMSVPEIIIAVVNASGHLLNLTVENRLDMHNFPKREICTQYNQSDADFVRMLAQEEQFAISFDSGGSAPYKMVLSHINEHAKPLGETLECSFNRAKGFAPTCQAEDFYDFEMPSIEYATEHGSSPESAELADNGTSAQLRSELKVQTLRDRLERMEGSRMKDLMRYAKLDAAAGYGPAELISGRSESLYTDDSRSAELHEKETGKTTQAIITATTLTAEFPNALDEYVDETAEYAFHVVFEAIPAGVPYVPEPKVVKPVISGIQTAIVASSSPDTPSGENTIDVDELGRIRLLFHFDRERPTSCYVRLGTIFSGNNWGAQFLPRVNTEVIVSFINGDIDRPVITGALYNGENAIPHALPDAKTRSYIKTNSMPADGEEQGYNELLFEDKSAEELLSLRAQKDYKLHALHDSAINIDNDQVEAVGNDESIAIGHDRTETVGNDESVSIGNNRTKSVESNESVRIGDNLSVTVGGNHVETVSQNKAETVAIAKALTVGAGYQVSVGGAKNETVGLSSSEQVGVLKHILAGKRFELQVGQSSIILNADGTILISGSQISINGTKQVTVNGKMVEIN
jgi:type VI secretion system secreted protein VgrG